LWCGYSLPRLPPPSGAGTSTTTATKPSATADWPGIPTPVLEQYQKTKDNPGKDADADLTNGPANTVPKDIRFSLNNVN
jgi:hypothetical protein